MSVQRLYHFLKPVLSRGLQIRLRRLRGRRILQRCGGFWPINEAAGRTPNGWPGWPGEKQFALILTHDVEKARGVERVRQLAELEMAYGFRSSFNFVPEGGYEIPSGLRSWLVQNGFEVGIQDLRHDGLINPGSISGRTRRASTTTFRNGKPLGFGPHTCFTNSIG